MFGVVGCVLLLAVEGVFCVIGLYTWAQLAG